MGNDPNNYSALARPHSLTTAGAHIYIWIKPIRMDECFSRKFTQLQPTVRRTRRSAPSPARSKYWNGMIWPQHSAVRTGPRLSDLNAQPPPPRRGVLTHNNKRVCAQHWQFDCVLSDIIARLGASLCPYSVHPNDLVSGTTPPTHRAPLLCAREFPS